MRSSSELELSSLKVRFTEDFGIGKLFNVWDRPYADDKSRYFAVHLDLEVIPVVRVKQSNNQMNDLLVRSRTWNGERHLARTIYPSREKPHTHYATNMRGPSFILVTQLTTKMKRVIFLNGRGKTSPLKFGGRFITNLTEAVRMT